MYDLPVCVGGLLKVAMTYQYDNLLLMHAIHIPSLSTSTSSLSIVGCCSPIICTDS